MEGSISNDKNKKEQNLRINSLEHSRNSDLDFKSRELSYTFSGDEAGINKEYDISYEENMDKHNQIAANNLEVMALLHSIITPELFTIIKDKFKIFFEKSKVNNIIIDNLNINQILVHKFEKSSMAQCDLITGQIIFGESFLSNLISKTTNEIRYAIISTFVHELFHLFGHFNVDIDRDKKITINSALMNVSDYFNEGFTELFTRQFLRQYSKELGLKDIGEIDAIFTEKEFGAYDQMTMLVSTLILELSKYHKIPHDELANSLHLAYFTPKTQFEFINIFKDICVEYFNSLFESKEYAEVLFNQFIAVNSEYKAKRFLDILKLQIFDK